MKHIFLFCLFFIASLQIIKADETKAFSISFNKSQFSFSNNETGALEICTKDNKMVSSFDTNGLEPELPWVSVDVKMPFGTSFRDFDFSTSQVTLFEDVVVAEIQPPIPTDSITTQHTTLKLPQYPNAVYPSTNIRYIMSSTTKNEVVLHFLVCPFIYEAKDKRLHLVDNLTLNIHHKTEGPTTKEERRDLFLQKFPNVIASGSAFITDNDSIGFYDISSSLNDSIDYIIITSDELYDDFKPWARWKTQKGVRTKIVSVEDIEIAYGDNFSTENAIKSLLAALYYQNGLKYALLGGDDTIVPSKKCCGLMGTSYEDRQIPTDLFYACLDYQQQDLFWDKNGNGICGELADSISMEQFISVTRLPVRTSEDVKNTISKLMGYEQYPLANGWNNNMLTAGTRILYNSYTTHSDAETSGDKLYEQFIAPYWNGTRKKLYDTFSDVEDSVADREGLQNQLSKGYTFADLICHGGENHWGLYYKYIKDSPASKYMTDDALELNNSGYTIITTNACSTNAFDWEKEDPCLSEALIRNPNSGVVAYLGSSRYGWYSSNLGLSLQYEARFYENLLSSLHEDKNFGTIVAAAKGDMVSFCNRNNQNRWLQFSINPIGDPETPIFTTTPSKFTNTQISFGQKKIDVDTRKDSCTICIMSTNDDGESYYEVRNNVRKATFKDITKDVSVCITKQNYIPIVFYLKAAVITNYMIGCTIYDKERLRLDISTELAYPDANGVLKVVSATGNNSQTYKVSQDSPNISVDVATWNKGVYAVSLYVEGKLVDSKSIFIE